MSEETILSIYENNDKRLKLPKGRIWSHTRSHHFLRQPLATSAKVRPKINLVIPSLFLSRDIPTAPNPFSNEREILP